MTPDHRAVELAKLGVELAELVVEQYERTVAACERRNACRRKNTSPLQGPSDTAVECNLIAQAILAEARRE